MWRRELTWVGSCECFFCVLSLLLETEVVGVVRADLEEMGRGMVSSRRSCFLFLLSFHQLPRVPLSPGATPQQRRAPRCPRTPARHRQFYFLEIDTRAALSPSHNPLRSNLLVQQPSSRPTPPRLLRLLVTISSAPPTPTIDSPPLPFPFALMTATAAYNSPYVPS